MKEKILIALSDQNLTSMISQRLAKDGYTPIVAKSGEDALEKMRVESPDLTLIDLVLSGKDGYEVLSDKMLDRMITKIPVIIVSNSGLPIDMKRLPSTSNIVKDYVIKAHIEPDDIMEKVNAAFGRSNKDSKSNNNGGGKAEGKKILWVEDDKLLGSILFKKFESSGHTVLFARDGEEAFAILEKEVPGIIILDVLLTGMNGFEILQKIKTNDKLRNIPVIMLSNMSKPSDIEKAKTLGAQKFLVKVTVSLDEIIKEVDALLKI